LPRLEALDSNGLLPLRAGEKAFVRAFDFRRQLQKVLPGQLLAFPAADPPWKRLTCPLRLKYRRQLQRAGPWHQLPCSQPQAVL
jgi:hypothetical protein